MIQEQTCDNKETLELSFLTGIQSKPKNQWLMAISSNWQTILKAPTMVERKEILDNLANSIRGIGPVTVDETSAYIEIMLYSQGSSKHECNNTGD